MFISADQVLVHVVGDYFLQSDWMATIKTQSWKPAFWHALTYTLCFLVMTRSPLALAFVFGTHLLIDRFRLARYVCWAKNFLAPKWIDMYTHTFGCDVCGASQTVVCSAQEHVPGPCNCKAPYASADSGMYRKERTQYKARNYPWSECVGTGYHKDRPPFLAVWLLIIVDNAMHLMCNGVALKWLV